MQRVLEHVTVDTFLLAFNYDLVRRRARRVLPVAEGRGCARMVGAIFARGLATPSKELLTNPPGWMTADLLARYRAIYDLQAGSGMSLAEMGVRFMTAQSEPNVIIIGAKTPSEIEECVRAAEAGALPADLVRAIEEAGTESA
jgi:aryl-alcohol dehydrogenase-like predicted oxidoreductase